MRSKIVSFLQKNFSERTRENIRGILSFLLYSWLFVLVLLPLIIFKFLRLYPTGKKFYLGTPLPRYYWDKFLKKHLRDFKGDGIEIDSRQTIQHYSDLNRLQNGEGLDVLHAIDIAPGGDHEYVADVSECWVIDTGKYDLFLVQFSFHMILRDKEAMFHSLRILKEGGVLICNFPCVSGYYPKGLVYKDFTGHVYRWYTPIGVELLLKEMGLSEDDYELVSHGHWIARMAYLGFYLPKEVIPSFLIDKDDLTKPMLVSVRIKKPANWAPLFQLVEPVQA